MIIGEGKQRANLKSFADQLGISYAILWTGFRKDVPRLFAGMDIFVQPSINEGLSLSLLEAMAAGKPIIATDVGGTSEVVADGKTGILIPSGSSSAIGNAIIELLQNPDKCSYLSQEAKKLVLKDFTVQRMMADYQQLYEKLLS
jgi:glycosyltransferase involved in cell wall biosynthesis